MESKVVIDEDRNEAKFVENFDLSMNIIKMSD
jgi:hypothetical protein